MGMTDAHAVVIGIANYKSMNKLPAAVLNDVEKIREVLIDRKRCGYAKENVTLLRDELATKSAIMAALNSAAQKCNYNSTFFLYISSHGGRIETGPNAGHYLMPVDGVYRPDRIAETGISGDELTAALRAIPARKLVVIFDCCHAGGLGVPKGGHAPEFKSGLNAEYYAELVKGTGRVILASSRDWEESTIMPGADNSLFTHHLLAGLRGKAPGNDEFIRIFNLFEYVQAEVTPLQVQQHPVFKAEIEDNFPIALRLGGKKNPAATVQEEVPFDAYVSFADSGNDRSFVREKLLPALRKKKIKVAISNDVEELGVARVATVNRGIARSKRTIVIVSSAWQQDTWANFEQSVAATIGIDEGRYRVIPALIESIDRRTLPLNLRALTSLSFVDGSPFEQTIGRLVAALRSPVPGVGAT